MPQIFTKYTIVNLVLDNPASLLKAGRIVLQDENLKTKFTSV